LHGAKCLSGARKSSVFGNSYQGFELSYLHVSSIQMRTIQSMRLIDTPATCILVSACFTQPPQGEAELLQKGHPPPRMALLRCLGEFHRSGDC